MNWKQEWKAVCLIVGIFFLASSLPIGHPRVDSAILEAFHLAKWYAQEHVLLCLIPAFFIAGAIGVFISQASVMTSLGAQANKILAYGVASVSGTILAVCSCTVLPLFAGIYRMGAGLGPASTFLYSGPAINALAIVLTARILGLRMGIARAVSAILFSIIIGLLMHVIFRKEELEKATVYIAAPDDGTERPLWQTATYFATMMMILIFANWGKPDISSGIYYSIYAEKWLLTSLAAAALACELAVWFQLAWWKVAAVAVPAAVLALLFPHKPMRAFAAAVVGLSAVTSTDKGETGEWFSSSWGFAKQILPLLLFGVLAAGALLGRVGHEGLIPSQWISSLLGGNSLWSNLFASLSGAFMYFATLTEVPILQGLMGNGMGDGPALALLLAGPALSLPNMLVIRSIMGTRKTVVFVSLVIVMAAIAGFVYGTLVS
ncbi:hypothetical protein CSB45_05245 [candidate division KSB3 bacterium]|uniref:Permease n=1 Tax=candidate division KSB3 bacterium TaxID=2044937 RepID=A0A2G6E7N2_9BACT|nr:MAG: hypothetical protein CSB45_05245 [candidate division KSB3 bacterium]PIE30456.1 MAG: hypothetical protein CSA57_04010 [candidate division KSB3 bacterium]